MLIFELIKKFLAGSKKHPTVQSYTSNSSLKTVRPNWHGTPLDQDGLFINPEIPTILDYKQIFKFLVERNPQREYKRHDTWRIEVLKDDSWLNDSKDKIVWIGHATFFIQLSGVRIIIDPIFGKLPIVRRYSELPIDPQMLLNIDYILISHSHMDHCDKASIKLLSANNPNAEILCGLELDKTLSKWTNNRMQAAGWYQQYNLKDDLQITFVPSRHWANRSVFDVNTTLWGGFVIQMSGKSIYYGGDSGYGSHFGDIGSIFTNVDVALIGAGAYAPTWFMGQHHQDPYRAVDAFHAIGAKTFIPFHYGTFDSADEPLGEPEQILTKLHSEGKIKNQLKILRLGEPFEM